MSKVLKCSLNKQKNPLKLMEMPENGPLHSYGDPVSKSINPCTVKQVQSLKENAKWISPDRSFLKKSEISRKKSSKKSKSDLGRSENSSPSLRTKPRRRRYPQLEMVPNDDSRTNDDNKENIRPDRDNPHVQQPSCVTSEYKPTEYSRTFSGHSHHRNLL